MKLINIMAQKVMYARKNQHANNGVLSIIRSRSSAHVNCWKPLNWDKLCATAVKLFWFRWFLITTSIDSRMNIIDSDHTNISCINW